MVIPLTTENGRGGVLRVKRELQGYAARFIFTTQIFHCVGGRDSQLSERLHDSFARGEWRSVQSLRRKPHEPARLAGFTVTGSVSRHCLYQWAPKIKGGLKRTK